MNHVEQDQEPLVQQLSPTVTMTKFSVGPTDNNIYLLTDEAGTVLIDAANKADRIAEVVGDRDVQTIITTHRHTDHICALAGMRRRTDARVVCGEPDAAAIENATGVANETVWTGDTIALPGGEELEVIGLVGHTPGGITLAYRGDQVHLFTGDCLFPGGPGNTNSPEDFASLMDGLEERVFGAFDDSAVVHPGHGDCTTLGDERPSVPQWRERGW